MSIDVRSIAHIDIDPVTRTARVGAGVKNGELDAACGLHGMYVTAGTNTDTGVAGLTLGGGFGHLCRQLGMTVDSLVECTVVLANGEIVRGCSETKEPDLLWV
jgi:FAD/FMN-containing dehydrogenase